MKRCFYSMMAAMALLLLSACSSDDELSQGNGNEALVSFNVELSGGMQNKAISDGTTAKNLTVHVFDENGTYLSELDKTVELNEKKKSVSSGQALIRRIALIRLELMVRPSPLTIMMQRPTMRVVTLSLV